MFFAIDLLIPQHGGKFALAWLAATRGIHYVSKKDALQCDIIQLCDEIIKMIQSSSTRPRLRLSLSLASRLVNGVTKIYKRQVEIMADDLMTFLVEMRKPIIIDSSISVEDVTPRAPVPRVQRKRKRKAVELSEEPIATPAAPTAAEIEDFMEPQIIIDEAALARPPILQVDPDHITLREELLIGPRQEMALGDFGMLEDVEPPAFPGALLQVAVSLPPEVAPLTPEKRRREDDAGTPSKRRAIIKEIDVPQALKDGKTQPISEVPPQDEVQVVPDISRPEIPMVHEIPELEGAPQVEAPSAEVPEHEVQPVRKKKVVTPFTAKTNMNVRGRRFVHINRCLPNVKEFFDLEGYEYRPVPALPKPIAEHFDVYELIAAFMQEHDSPEEYLAEMRVSSRTRESLLRSSSLSLLQTHGRVTSAALEGTPVPPLPVTPTVEPLVSLEPPQIVVQADVHAPIDFEVPMLPTDQVVQPQIPMEATPRLDVPEKTMIPLAESTGVSLPQIDTEILAQLPEHTFETVAPPAAETAPPHRAVIWSPTSSERIRASTKDRQKRMRDLIKKWNTEEQGEITLEGVCDKAVNRTNIARAFYDLLSLHKMGYVVLNSKPNSLELGTIEKGKRILGRK